MALETASWITELVTTNPVAGDPVGEGDDHLRMLKTVLQNSFPSSSTAAVIPNMSGNGGSILITDGTDSAWSSVAYIDTLNSRVGIGNAAPTATLDVDGSAIFNESGAAVDFRIEGITEPNLFFVDGTNSRVGIGTSAPTTIFEIYSSWGRLKIFSPSYSTVGYDLVTSGGTGAIELTKPQGYNLHLLTSNNIALMPTKKCVGINQSLPTSHLQIDGDDTANAWGTDGIILRSSAATITDNNTAASGTAATAVFNSFGTPTLAATNASVTTTDAATVYIAGAPAAGTNQTITNPYALWVDDGDVKFDGDLNVAGTSLLASNKVKISQNSFRGEIILANGYSTTSIGGVGSIIATGTSNSDHEIAIYTQGTRALLVDNSSNVTIDNNLYVTKGAVFNESGADVDFRIEGDTEPNLFFVDGSTDRVGIGTATPRSVLDIDYPNGGGVYLGRTNISSGVLQSNNSFFINIDANSTYNNQKFVIGKDRTGETGGVDLVTVLESGNVGIGTASPGALLDVNGGDALIHTLTVGLGAGSVATNTAVGLNALYANTTGSSNAAFGRKALESNTIGTGNMAFGDNAVRYNTDGIGNVGIGLGALTTNITGDYNIAIGQNALNTTTASNNIAIGRDAARYQTTGSNNTAVGYSASRDNLTGTDITAVGYNALLVNTGNANTALGSGALFSNTTGTPNVAVGKDALYSNETSDSLVAVGYQALYNHGKVQTAGTFVTNVSYTIKSAGNTDFTLIGAADSNPGTVFTATGAGTGTGTATPNVHRNVAVGRSALYNNTTAQSNTAVGFYALANATSGGYNVALGDEALRLNTTGQANVALGHTALYTNTTGGNNVGIGFETLNKNQTGSYSTAVGYRALKASTNGYNDAFGYKAGTLITTATGNVAVGQYALTSNVTALDNTAVGSYALEKTTGTGNTALGRLALQNNTTGIYNVGLGRTSLINSTGSHNTGVGAGAGSNLTSGSNNIIIGTNAQPSSATVSNEITLGDANVTDFRLPGPDIFSSSTETVFNESGANKDFRVEGDTEPNLFFVDASADAIGIGTSSPSQLLELAVSSGAVYQLFDNSTTQFYNGITSGNAGLISVNTNHPLIFSTNNLERVRITNAGNVGIGTSSPGALLDVNGNVNVEGMITAKQQSLSGPGAVNVTDLITEITTTGTGDALTLANGTAGQMKIITYVAEGAGADTAVLTPTTLNGGTTITFNNLGDGATLVYGTSGWTVVGINGAVIA